MTSLCLLSEPNSILYQKSQYVDVFDKKLNFLVNGMFELMKKKDGIGLASNQVGILKRIVVINISHIINNNHKENSLTKLALINPEIIWHSDSQIVSQEGCLSIPNVYEEVKRFEKIRVRYQNIFGIFQEIEGSGLLSFCLQHELDHINGILFTDHLSIFKRMKIKKKFLK